MSGMEMTQKKSLDHTAQVDINMIAMTTHGRSGVNAFFSVALQKNTPPFAQTDFPDSMHLMD